MNAAADSNLPASPRAMATPHPTHKFRLLLRREFWEHKGGFFWAPVIAGGISLVLTLMAIIVGLVAARRAADAGHLELDGINVSGLDLGQLTQQMSPQDMAEFANGINLSLVLGSSWPFIVLAFVVFFYSLGALYDERKDRSVLFWKSLPLSDTETVLSKVASAVLVAPAIAVGVAILTMFAFMVMISAVVVMHGGNAWTLIWGPASPMGIIAGHLAWIPVYALWALPTVGWLLLCSVWARSAPFLWAVMVPVVAGVLVSWFKLMDLFNLDASWFWTNIVGRALLGTVPAIDQVYRDDFSESVTNSGLENLVGDMSFTHQIASLSMPDLWIGAIAGAAMIFAAIRLRRWRDEG